MVTVDVDNSVVVVIIIITNINCIHRKTGQIERYGCRTVMCGG